MSASRTDSGLSDRDSPATDPRTADLTEPFLLGDWRIEPALRKASNGSAEVKIDPRNLRVLQVLAQRQGKIVSPREIEALAWEGVVVTQDSLYQSIRQLRQALGDTKSPAKYIETVARRGYRIVAQVERVPRHESPSLITDQCSRKVGDAENQTVCDSISPSPAAGQGNRPLLFGIGLGLLVTLAGYLHFSIPPQVSSSQSAGTTTGFAHGVSASASPKEIKPQGDLDARRLRTLGATALRSGQPRKALAYFEHAYKSQISVSGRRSEVVVEILLEIANAHFWLDDEISARSAIQEAIMVLDGLVQAPSPDRIPSLNLLADVLIGFGEYSRAEGVIDDALTLARRHYQDSHPTTIESLVSQATLRYAQGRLVEAEHIVRSTMEPTVRARGADSVQIAYAHMILSSILVDLARFSDAETHARLAIRIVERIANDQHPYILSSKHILGEALLKQKKYPEAELLFREELVTLKQSEAIDWRVGRAAGALGEALLFGGKLEEAERYLSLANSKLTRRVGWPMERENRHMAARFEMLNAMRPESGDLVSLTEVLPSD